MQHYVVLLTLLALLAWPATSRSATLQLHAHLTHVDSGRGFTEGELLRWMVARSRARAAKLCPSGPGCAVTVPAVSSSGVIGSNEYLIHLGIGTPRPQHVALEVDTGSNVIWTQCAPCFKCFDQRFPEFNTSASDTVHGVACSDPLCQGLQKLGRACFLGGCAYRLAYGDKSVSMGQLAKDSFTFQQGSSRSRRTAPAGRSSTPARLSRPSHGPSSGSSVTFVSQVPLPHIPYDDDGPGELQCFQTDSVPDASKVPVPKLILHLEGGADWELPRENYMAKHPNLDDQLCLVIDSAGDDLPTIIGNFQFQQQNMHIVYDLAGNKLLIVPAQCHNM